MLVLPPAPAALVLLGRTLATLSFWSAAALLRMAVLGPPGGVGDDGRPVLCPTGAEIGEVGRGEDWKNDKLATVNQKYKEASCICALLMCCQLRARS